MNESFQYLRHLENGDDLPALNKDLLQPSMVSSNEHAPRILMLYGSLRERSYSRFATEEAARILKYLGADVRIF